MSAAHTTLVGRLARDPESRTSAKGTTIVKLTIPVDTGWGENKTTTWWTAAIFGKQAERAQQYLNKGSWVCVSGNASVRSYEKRDGSTGHSAEIAVDSWSFVGPKQQDDNEPYRSSAPTPTRRPLPAEEDMPF